MPSESDNLSEIIAPEAARMKAALALSDMPTALSAFDGIRRALGRDKRWMAKAYIRNVFNVEKFRAGEPYVASFRNGQIEARYWMIFGGKYVYADETMRRNIANHSWVGGLGTPDNQQFLIEIPRESIRLDESAILLCGDDNYAHWLFRCLPRLALIADGNACNGRPFLTSSKLGAAQNEMLDILGIGDSARLRIEPDNLYGFGELTIPVCPLGHPFFGDCVTWLRERLLREIAPPSGTKRRLFVSRRDAARRVLLNEQEIKDLLVGYGFEPFVPGDHTFSEQAVAFANAEIVIGPHGAGLANLLFAPPSCRVLELSDSYMVRIDEFELISEVFGLRYERLVSDDIVERDPPTGESPFPFKYHDFRVEPEAVRAALERLLRA